MRDAEERDRLRKFVPRHYCARCGHHQLAHSGAGQQPCEVRFCGCGELRLRPGAPPPEEVFPWLA